MLLFFCAAMYIFDQEKQLLVGVLLLSSNERFFLKM